MTAITEITLDNHHRVSWDEFMRRYDPDNITQSSDWLLFQQAAGKAVTALVAFPGEQKSADLSQAVMIAGVIREELVLGKLRKFFWYIPRGPIIAGGNQISAEMLQALATDLHQRAHNSLFTHIEPAWEGNAAGSAFKEAGFSLSFKHLAPQETVVVPLARTDEELLASVHPKHRYNIRLAQKKGVTVRAFDAFDEQSFADFWALMHATGERQQFGIHGRQYYAELLRFFMPRRKAMLWSAYYEGRCIASHIIFYQGSTVTYLHGGMDYAHRSVMAPILIHWATMQEARDRGYMQYDLWGIDAQRWPSLSLFKKRFGGTIVHYVGSFDAVYQPLPYAEYRAITQLRKKK